MFLKEHIRRTGPCGHRGGAAQVAACGRHGDGVQASWSEGIEGALSGLPGEEPLSHDGGRLRLSEERGEAVPFTDRPIPQDAQPGFVGVTDGQLLHGTRGWRDEGKEMMNLFFYFVLLLIFYSEAETGR